MAAKKTRTKTPKGTVAMVPDDAVTTSPTANGKPKKSASSPQKGSRTKASTTTTKAKPPPRRPRTWKGWFFSWTAWIYSFYAIYQYFWTCNYGQDSRYICRYGDTALDYIEPYVLDLYDQYIDPHYAEYLESYVEKATPYVIIANEKYVQPARVYAVEQFEKHGKPQLVKAQQQVLAEYSSRLGPHVEKARAQGLVYYNDYLADAVTTGQELYVAYYPVAERYAKQGYDFAIEKGHPYYLAALPYIKIAWEKALETAGWVGLEGKGWVVRRWGMHVEPQLWRIQERLGKRFYEKTATPVQEGAPTAPHNSNPNASSSDTNSKPDTKVDTKVGTKEAEAEANTENKGNDKPPGKKNPSDEAVAAAREQVEADLDAWGKKFEEAGGKAAEQVVTKLNKLCEKVLEAEEEPSILVIKNLNNRIEKELMWFEQDFKTISEADMETKYALTAFDNMIQGALGGIKEKHELATTHTQTFLMDTYQETAKIVDAALADLDAAHDAGMQELGMKWAWMDGVTYKDWAKYHDLKKGFAALKTKVIRAGQGHPKLREVTDYAKSIDESAGKVAKVATDEIKKMATIARKKLEERDNIKEEPVAGKVTEPLVAEEAQVESPVSEKSETLPVPESENVQEPVSEEDGTLPVPVKESTEQDGTLPLPVAEKKTEQDGTLPIPVAEEVTEQDGTLPLPEAEKITEHDGTLPIPEAENVAEQDGTLPVPQAEQDGTLPIPVAPVVENVEQVTEQDGTLPIPEAPVSEPVEEPVVQALKAETVDESDVKTPAQPKVEEKLVKDEL